MSHALPSGELASLFERALDELIRSETKRRLGAQKPRKRRALKPGSRHVPVEVARAVWERDGGQCAWLDAQGNRCSARRFLTLEHRTPFALGGSATVENLCLYCSAHNQHAAKRAFGERHIEHKRAVPTSVLARQEVSTKVLSALKALGFDERQASRALTSLAADESLREVGPLLRAALELLTRNAA